MKDAAPNPVWPYIGMLLGLFVLTVAAVSTWRIPTSPAVAQSPSAGPGSGSSSGSGSGSADRPPSPPSSPPSVPDRASKGVEPEDRRESGPLRLHEFAGSPQSAPVAPPITGPVELDLPSLPDSTSAGLGSAPSPRTASLPRRTATSLHGESGLPSFSPDTIARTSGKSHPSWNQALTGWPYSIALAERIHRLQHSVESSAQVRELADDALGHLHRLGTQSSVTAADVPVILRDIRKLLQDVPRVGQQLASREEQAALYRTMYALRRRLEVWEAIAALGRNDLWAVSSRTPRLAQDAPASEARILREVGDVLETVATGPQWKEYLGFADLERLKAEPIGVDRDARMQAARHTLRQMQSHRLNEEQLQLLDQHPFQLLRAMLRDWAQEPIDYLRLLREIEHYEHCLAADSAFHLSEMYQRLQFSTHPQLQQLAKAIDTYYRNANARLAVSADLINRLMSHPVQSNEPVQDQILGALVTGRSSMTTQLRVVLIPDPARWRLGLEAEGAVQSETSSRRGPVTFFNNGRSRYEARKFLFIDRRGIFVHRAEADAIADSKLTGLETDFDTLPLLGVLVRAIAVQQHDLQQDEARWEVRGKVATKVSQRLDEEVHVRLEKVEDEFRRRILQPLQQLELDPVALDMHTTERRLVARYRLAGSHQLAAHTPRPQAPSDSVLSLQLNQTAISNTIDQLHLNHRRFELRELFRSIANRFDVDLEIPDDIPGGVYVRLAEKDPLLVECEEGLVQLTIRFAELSREHGDSWHDFEIHLAYKPQIDGLDATLNRAGIIELRGDHLSFTDRFPLRAIFAKVFAKKRPLHLVNSKLRDRPELQDLEVTQFTIHDGWIGLAVGPVKQLAQANASEREVEPSPGIETRR